MAIVCATHFTQSSGDALAVAAQLAKRTGRPLWMVSVTSGFAFNPSFGPPEAEQAASASLHAQADALRKDGLKVEVAVLHGRMERSVERLCNDVGAGLLVLGDTRHVTPSFWSTPADRLASVVSVPLLVVRSRRPFEAWARGDQALRVLLALDHTWRSEVARDWLTRLSAYGALDVLAAHVWSREDERLRRHTTVEDFQQLLESETAAALTALPQNVKTRVMLAHAHADIASTLVELADAETSDLIALGTHGPKGLLARLRSVSHEVLVHGHASVALVPDRDPVTGPLDRMTPTSPRTRKLHILRER